MIGKRLYSVIIMLFRWSSKFLRTPHMELSYFICRIERLARDVSDYFQSEPIVALCVLKGGYRYVEI